jgi:hypothetical protein
MTLMSLLTPKLGFDSYKSRELASIFLRTDSYTPCGLGSHWRAALIAGLLGGESGISMLLREMPEEHAK